MKLNVERELAGLQKLSTAQLGDRYAEVYGETARSRHRAYLIRKIIWRMQALAEGNLSERARRRPKNWRMTPASARIRRTATSHLRRTST